MKTAICGVWHVHAADYTKKALEKDGVEVIGFFEENDRLAAEFGKKFNLFRFASFDDLLKSDAEAVIVCCPTDKHADCIITLADAKKDVFTEKVLALSTDDCMRVKEAVDANGIRFVISLFQKSLGGIRTIKALADSGRLGHLNYVRFRNCHNGSTGDWLPSHFFNKTQCGGGAMIDLGAHGMYIVDWFLGLPSAYRSAFTVRDNNPKNTDRLEDNAVTVMTYEDGTIAINETGFVSAGSPAVLEVGGDRGFARYTAGKNIEIRIPGENADTTIPAMPDLPLPIDAFLSGKTLKGCGIDDAVNLTVMMEGAYLSQK